MKEDIISFLKNGFIVGMTLAIVIAIFIPLPALLLDIFIALNLIFAITLLIIAFCTEKVKNLSIYPALLLLFTIFNLAVNISATRLILTKGAQFDGRLIKVFSSLIVGSENERLIMGYVIFVIILCFNVLLIVTKGCSRVSEVAARFTLDSFTVKLMAIDTEYSCGAITEDEAQVRKIELQRESDFYGAMDGASKFLSGNEKIRILIIAVSHIVVTLIGILQKDESINDVIKSYIPLVISNGILNILPAFLVSLADGIIVTRKEIS